MYARPCCEVLEVLDSAAELGITVIRTWGFSDGRDRDRQLWRLSSVSVRRRGWRLGHAVADTI
jgi:hypothetical protein